MSLATRVQTLERGPLGGGGLCPICLGNPPIRVVRETLDVYRTGDQTAPCPGCGGFLTVRVLRDRVGGTAPLREMG